MVVQLVKTLIVDELNIYYHFQHSYLFKLIILCLYDSTNLSYLPERDMGDACLTLRLAAKALQ